MRRFQRAATPLVIALAVVVVLLETTIWRWLIALGRALGRLSFFAHLERLVERLSPGAVVAVFVLPFVPIIPLLKFGELWLIRHHHFVSAAILIVGAKVVGAAFSTRVFAVARPKMLQVRWFARLYAGTTWLLDLGHETLERLPGWAAARRYTHRLRLSVRKTILTLGGAVRAQFARQSYVSFGRRLAAALRKVRG